MLGLSSYFSNVQVASAAAGVAIFGGDCGFEFASKVLRPLAHIGYEIDGLTIDKAFRIGMVLNGLSDNVYRASMSHGYQMQLDPAQPGLNGVIVRNTRLNGDGSEKSLGMFITAVSKVQMQNVTINDFDIGVRIKDWINGLQFKNCDLSRNREGEFDQSFCRNTQRHRLRLSLKLSDLHAVAETLHVD